MESIGLREITAKRLVWRVSYRIGKGAAMVTPLELASGNRKAKHRRQLSRGDSVASMRNSMNMGRNH